MSEKETPPIQKIASSLLFFRADEAEKLVKEAFRHRGPYKPDYDLALTIQYMKEAIRLRPEREKYHHLLGWIYSNLPYDAVTYGINVDLDLSESANLAIAEFKEAIKLKPNEPVLYAALAVSYMDLGEKEKAEEAIGKVMEIRGGVRYRRLVNQLTQELTEGMSPNPNPGEARRYIGRAISYRDMGNFREAEKEMEMAFKLAPNRVWLYRTLCELGQPRQTSRRRRL